MRIRKLKKWVKEFESVSGELPLGLMLGLKDNQVLQFSFPKDVDRTFKNNRHPLFFSSFAHKHIEIGVNNADAALFIFMFQIP